MLHGILDSLTKLWKKKSKDILILKGKNIKQPSFIVNIYCREEKKKEKKMEAKKTSKIYTKS